MVLDKLDSLSHPMTFPHLADPTHELGKCSRAQQILLGPLGHERFDHIRSFMITSSSRYSVSTIACGVPAGAKRPHQMERLIPRTPGLANGRAGPAKACCAKPPHNRAPGVYPTGYGAETAGCCRGRTGNGPPADRPPRVPPPLNLDDLEIDVRATRPSVNSSVDRWG